MVLARGAISEKTQEGYIGDFNSNDTTGTVARVMRHAKSALSNDKVLNKNVRDDLNFALGDQWTDEERQILKDEGRPCLTFNKVEAFLNLVGGWERENSMRIRVFPEGREDRIFSDIGDKCIASIDKWSKLNYKLDHLFDDGIDGGKGWLEMAITYDDDIINGDLLFPNRKPWEILVDPDSVEYDHSDADWQIKMVKFSKAKLKRMFPKAKDKIESIKEDVSAFLSDVSKEGDKDNYHEGKDELDIDDVIAPDGRVESEDDKIWLFEEWYKKYIEQYFVYDYRNHNLEKFDKIEEAEARKAEILQEAEAVYQQAVVGHALKIGRASCRERV